MAPAFRVPPVSSEAVIVKAQPLGLRNADGEELYGLTLAVGGNGTRGGEAQIASPVPARLIRELRPGLRVPLGPDRDELTIDWRQLLSGGRHGSGGGGG